VDIMLMSASTSDVLAVQERLFDNSPVTPAARANDTTDIWVVRGNRYIQEPSRPFRTATIEQIQCGQVDCTPQERSRGANLGLYSITFNNRLETDQLAIEEYRQFRVEAEQKGFKHFLELFDPNNPQGLSPEQVPAFINDCIARILAGVPQAGRPLFLKMVYHGPKSLEELVSYDPHLVVGILGGGSGTTYDAFKLIAEAQKYGARVALFGRKINNAECQLAFVQFLRLIVEKAISPEDAVRAYHGVLENLKIRPQRKLEDDLQLQTNVMSYGGSSASVSVAIPAAASTPKLIAVETKAGCGCSGSKAAAEHKEHACTCTKPASSTVQSATVPPAAAKSATPDFSKMSRAEKLAFNRDRLNRIFG